MSSESENELTDVSSKISDLASNVRASKASFISTIGDVSSALSLVSSRLLDFSP